MWNKMILKGINLTYIFSNLHLQKSQCGCGFGRDKEILGKAYGYAFAKLSAGEELLFLSPLLPSAGRRSGNALRAFLGAGDGTRTRINSLEGCGNSPYTTPAFSEIFYVHEFILSSHKLQEN